MTPHYEIFESASLIASLLIYLPTKNRLIYIFKNIYVVLALLLSRHQKNRTIGTPTESFS